jgi:hypothetical protein
LSEFFGGKSTSGEKGKDGRVILKYILNKQGMKVWTMIK